MAAIRLPAGRSLAGPAGWLFALAYVAAFLGLDWVSYIRPLQGLNITPWNPQPALAVALLIWNPRAIVLVWVGLVCAELVVRGVPADWVPTLAVTSALSLAYAAIARALVRRIDLANPLATRAGLLSFSLVVTVGSLICALLFVLSLASAGVDVQGPWYSAVARYWIGDAVGFVVTLPILLIAMSGAGRAALVATARKYAWLAAAALSCAGVWLVFGREEQDYFKFFYLLLLPVLWSSVHFGVSGAVLSSMVTQLGLIAATHFTLHQDLTVFELQALMAASAITALLLGVLVDERARTAAELQTSLRFAAAGQMAAALAHELSQPLTALRNYVHAADLLARQEQGQPLQPELAVVMQHVAQEAQRAGEVVKRLRDFFQSGTTRMQLAPVEAVITEAVANHLDAAKKMNVALAAEIEPGLPPLWMDPLQIAVVLRNLLANALESAAAAQPARVKVGARRDGGHILVEVRDSGPGVEPQRLQALFEASPSAKPGGLGVGLNMSRAIVDGHGGTLWAEPGPGGRFFFTLPIEA
jgi:two-component system, LuxR family, sensor kinase FixL